MSERLIIQLLDETLLADAGTVGAEDSASVTAADAESRADSEEQDSNIQDSNVQDSNDQDNREQDPNEEHETDCVLTRRFRWGFVDELSNWQAVSHVGTDEEMLEALHHHRQSATLLIPGTKVVSLSVPYNKKEARHFLKLLPYQVEEDVVCPVDDLYFAAGSREAEVATVAYVDEHWLSQLLLWFKDNDLEVDCCMADYQCLHAEEEELILWFGDEDYVWGHRANGLGFSVSQSLSQAFLKDLLLHQQDAENPWTIRAYVNDGETKDIIQSHIIPSVNYEVIIGQPQLDFTQANQMNFCRGKFGKQLPIERWWQEAKPIVLLAAAAIAVFFVTTFADIHLLKQQQEELIQQRNDAYRAAIPRGPITDPVRRLKSMLGTEVVEQKSSQSVYLLSKIAPVMDKLSISLATLNYNNREQVLRINVSAESFAGIEAFRQELNQQGLSAELQSSSAAKEGYQARLRVSLKENQNG